MRLLALFVLVAVLPTVELAEQAVHAVGHAVHSEAPDHDAHHDEERGDEHGCTGLVHLCACHHAQVTAVAVGGSLITITTLERVLPLRPPSLVDGVPLEPPHRPPIG
jgi:hypothetical protein